MKTTFTEFLNEYSGKEKTLGFVYSKPTDAYVINIYYSKSLFSRDKTELIRNEIEKIVEKNEILCNKINIVKNHITVEFMSYSRIEMLSVLDVVVNGLIKDCKITIQKVFVTDLQGNKVKATVHAEPEKRNPIGFRQYNKEENNEE